MARDTIILVENDVAVRDVWAEFLAHEGYRLVLAGDLESGNTAIRTELAAQPNRLFAVVCADWMHGRGMNGPDLFLQRSVDLMVANVPFVLLVTFRRRGFIEYCESVGMRVLRCPCSLFALRDILIESPSAPPARSGAEL